MNTLLKPHEVDAVLRWPRGKTARLARRGRIPCLVLPDGSLRFDEAVLRKMLRPGGMIYAK